MGRGCRGPFIGAEKEGDRAFMAGIKSSPEFLRRDGRERDSGKKGRQVTSTRRCRHVGSTYP